MKWSRGWTLDTKLSFITSANILTTCQKMDILKQGIEINHNKQEFWDVACVIALTCLWKCTENNFNWLTDGMTNIRNQDYRMCIMVNCCNKRCSHSINADGYAYFCLIVKKKNWFYKCNARLIILFQIVWLWSFVAYLKPQK